MDKVKRKYETIKYYNYDNMTRSKLYHLNKDEAPRLFFNILI